MKKIYGTVLILLCLVVSSCKKDSQDLIVGTWELEDMYDLSGNKMTTNGKIYNPMGGGTYDYFTVTLQFDECISGEDSCSVNFTNTFYTNNDPYPVIKAYKYIFMDNSTFAMSSTSYEIAKLTKKKLEIYPTGYDKSIRTYNRK